jgi:hypothetical protein
MMTDCALTYVTQLIAEYCARPKSKYQITCSGIYYRSYDTGGTLNMSYNDMKWSVNYVFEDAILQIYKDSKYNPISTIYNVMSSSKKYIFKQLDKIVRNFITLKLQKKRQQVFYTLLFDVCDEYCSNGGSDESTDVFANFLEQYKTSYAKLS